MLTEQARQDRFWGGRKRLREVFQGAKIPDHIYGPSSVSDNIFTVVENMLKLAILIRENRELALQNARALAGGVDAEFLEGLYDEVGGVETGLLYLAGHLEDLSRERGDMGRTLRRELRAIPPFKA